MGNIEEREMFRVFNMGIGMMMIVPEKDVQEILDRLKGLGENAFLLGTIEKRDENGPPVCFTDL